MNQFKDLNELIAISRQINEGKYDVVDISLNPESELFHIAQYFSDALKRLRTFYSAVEDTYEDLPTFERVLKTVIDDSKKASEDVLTFVDKINFNIDEIKDDLAAVEQAVNNNDFARAKGLLDRLQDKGVAGQDVCFDIIASLEFEDITKQKVDKLVKIIHDLEERLAHLIILLGLKDNTIDSEVLDKYKDTKDILEDQTLVDKLLREFGM